MAKKIAKNTTSRSIRVNLPGNRTLKIRARGVAEVEEADLNCPTLLYHRIRKNILIRDAEETS